MDQLANKFLACRAFYLLVTRFYGANDDRAFLLTMKIKHSIKHQMSSQNNVVTCKKGVSKKRKCDFCFISVLEVGFNFFTCVSESEFRVHST